MAERSFGEEFNKELSKEVIGKAVVGGPAIAGLALLGPAGFLLGLAYSVVIADNLPSEGNSHKD